MLAFLLIVGVSYYAVATSLVGLVGDYLFSERMSQDRARTEKLAVEVAPVAAAMRTDELQALLETASGELGGRLMFIDAAGKIQLDSYSERNGSLAELPEVLSILADGKTVDYGVHRLQNADGQTRSALQSFLRPYSRDDRWVGYCSAAVVHGGETLGVLLFSSPVQEMLEGLFALQDRMVLYFVIAAAGAMVIALIFSRVITRPIAALTRGIQRMARGDLSVRVKVKGSGELKRLAQAFNTMSEKLELLDKSRNQFVSNASHELKTPLATMKILLENIIYQPDMENEVRTEFLVDVNKEIDRLNLIIGDLLTLVSMDAKNMRLNRENFSLAQIVQENAHRLTPMAIQRKQEIKLQLADSCEMYADCAKLTQVVYNLMENAIKYTQEGGVVRVRLVRSGKEAILKVTDNGPGIPKEDQAHIFDRFYRVDKARSRDTGGTGLGLSIVHQLVLMHGGSVSVESEEGHGATFTVELPIHQG